jgi:hypothetical protein
MFSSKKETKKINFFNKFFSSPKKKRAVFFVLLAFLVLGFFVALSNISHAAFTFANDAQKQSFITAMYGDPRISVMYSTNAAGRAKVESEKLPEYLSKYNSYEEASKALQGVPSYGQTIENPDPFSASINQFSGTAVLQGLADGLSEIVLAVVIGVLAVIAAFCKQFVSMGAQTLDFALNPNLYSFTSNTMIVQGWTVVRDVCNLFFLLILLFIAICTILKIEKYHAKKTLLMLIIMALLINFSKPIAIFIFDGSQLLMNFFLSQMGQTGTGQTTSTVVAKAADIAGLVYDKLPGYWGGGKSLDIAVQYLFAVVFLFMLAVAYIVTALMLIIRIVAIMLLIIVSPLAFFAAIVPDFSKMSSQWWSSLFEYSYYGPAAAFFLLLSSKLENALPQLTASTNSPGGANLSTTVNNIVHYLVVLVFLYASIFMAKKFGGGAGAAVVGNANRFMKWGAGMTKTGGAWGAMGRTTGVTGGVSQRLQQSGLTRWMTKEGRKRNQKAMEARVAGALGVTGARTKRLKEAADDLKNESNANIVRMAEGGDIVAAYVASNRGILDDDSRIINAIMPQLARDEDMRNEFVRNARKNGQTHQALQIRMQTDHFEEPARRGNPAAIAEHEMRRVATSDLAKNQNIGQLSQIPQALAALTAVFDELNTRLTTGTPEQRLAAQQQLNNIISDASAQNLAALTATPGGRRSIMT